MRGGKTALGKIAAFEIEQDADRIVKKYPIPKQLVEHLNKNKLTTDFNNLTASSKKDVLKYLSYVKTEETLLRNINKLINQLKSKEKHKNTLTYKDGRATNANICLVFESNLRVLHIAFFVGGLICSKTKKANSFQRSKKAVY